MKYYPPLGAEDDNADYENCDPVNHKWENTMPDARGFGATQREIVNFISSAGLIPSEEDNTQLTQAVAAELSRIMRIMDKKQSNGAIGDLKYTTRTDLPPGGVWCDGSGYTKEQFPDTYQMLLDGKLHRIEMPAFNEEVITNGVCGYFGLDTETETFRVPLLKDIFFKAGNGLPEFSAETLPNIKGSFVTGVNESVGTSIPPDEGPFFKTYHSEQWSIYSKAERKYTNYIKGFNASKVSDTYQDEAKVSPDCITYRAYIVLYSSVNEASTAQATAFIQALANKAGLDLSNVVANIDFVQNAEGTKEKWFMQFRNGFLIQGGCFTPSSNQETINLLRPYADFSYHISRRISPGYTGTVSTADMHTNQYPSVMTTNFTMRQDKTYANIISWMTFGRGEQG